MRLEQLLDVPLPGLRGRPSAQAGDVEIATLAYDSRAVGPGSLFFCVSGFQSDGHAFAADAVAAGAAALVVERPLGLGVPEILVESARRTMAPLAARFFGHPDRELRVVGVTGTNGKTTTAYLVRALLEATGSQCGLLGTVKSVIGGRESVLRAPPPRRSTCRPTCGRCSTAATAHVRSRSPRMRWRSGGPTRSSSLRPCSRT